MSRHLQFPWPAHHERAFLIGLFIAFGTLLSGATVATAQTLTLLPAEILLRGTEARQTLLVEEMNGDKLVGQLSAVSYESSNPQVVIVEEGVARPVGNGEAMLTAKAGERTATAKVKVDAMDQPFRWSFRNHVESVLA